MQGLRQNRQIGNFKVQNVEKDNIQTSTINLNSANQVIASTKSFSGTMGFEINNPDADLSGPATVTVEMSISGKYWETAVDINGVELVYSLTSGSTIMDAISGIPLGVSLRIIITENLTGTLIVSTRQ